jgi:radical SAM superfamily enzyme YgiQ (UPF0313 family)
LNGKPRVLFTANYGPNDLGGGEDLFNLMSTRWTRGHGAFRLDMFGHYFALYLIAENISNPSTVLENPHWEEFDAELDNGYDYVCFQLKSVHTAKIARMMKRVREKCPGAKIVVGGYGVGTLDTPVPGDVEGDAAYIREQADFLCREEGVRFMRRVLGDEPVEREITQYHIPMFSLGGFIGSNGVHMRIPMILVSLGCPNGCDFCNTSAFYRKKKIYVAEPEQVYRYIRNYQKRMRFREIIVMLWDEDFFLNPDYVRELGRLLRSHKSTWSVRYYTFGSIRSLSQYSPEELRDNGCQMVWIGVESFMCGGNGDDRYGKRQGAKVAEMFDGLRRHGIQPTGSLVLGLDFHTKENLKADADQFVALKPMFYQVSHVLPCPGTALYDRMAEEGRISRDYKWQDLHFWSDHVYKYQNCSRDDIKEAFQYIHDRLRDVNGPPTMQMMESVMDAYGLYRDAPDPFRQALARRDRLIAGGFYSFLHSIKNHHPSPAVRDRARGLEARYQAEIGSPPMISRALGRVITRNIRKKSGAPESLPASDPPPRWTYYHTYGDGVWVKKGRAAKKPMPYKDDSILAGVGLPAITSLIGKGKKGLKLLEGK